MAPASTPKSNRSRTLALGIFFIVLASQIYISLFSGDLNISVAIVLLPVLSFLFPGFPAMKAAVISAPGVFLLRLVFQLFAEGSLSGGAAAHAPEMLFYISYGILFTLYLRAVPLRPVRFLKLLPLVGVDACSNFLELLVRMGSAVFAPGTLLQLLAVGVGRSLLAWAALRTLDTYGLHVLRREDAERYQRLLLMTATLKTEEAWIYKSTTINEKTKNTAYRLYSQLRASGADSADVDAALTIAKDIHEVKKEYFLIMRGISEALDTDAAGGTMRLEGLLDILGQSTRRTAQAAGKDVVFSSACSVPFTTGEHHYLMSIFRNLLNNAVEAAPQDRQVHLSIQEEVQGQDVVFFVGDDCGGIPPKHLPQIFTPGFSSKINFTTGEVNRGLGLTIVKELVEDKLGGSITVTSQEGGTIFTIRIPKTRLEANHAAVSH